MNTGQEATAALQDEGEKEEIVVTAERIPELLHSKNFKERIAAYREIGLAPEYLGFLQEETVIPALEVALDVVGRYPGPIKLSHIIKFVPLIAHTKTSIRKKAESVLERVANSETKEVAEVLIELLGNKSAKIVERAASKLVEILQGEDKKEIARKACPLIPKVLGLADQSAKKAGMGLVVEIYKKIFKEVEPFLEGIKPIILKELNTEFSKYEAPKMEINLSEYKFDDSNWKIRLEGMNALKESKIDPNSFEILQILQQRLRDVNVQVATAAVEAVRNGEVRHPDVIRLMMQRYKDKKAKLTATISEALLYLKPTGVVISEALQSKNPEIKIGLLRCIQELKSKGSNEMINSCIEELGALLDDSNPIIRSLASSILDGVSELSSEKQAKVCKLLNKVPSECAAAKAKPQSESNNGKIEQGGVKRVSNPTRTFSKEQLKIPKRESLKSYENSVTLLKSTDWRKRLTYLVENKEELLKEKPDILLELIGSKETNLNIVKQVFEILSQHPQVKGYTRDIAPLLFLRISESKLRRDILSIFYLLDPPLLFSVFESNLTSASSHSVGKRFVALLEALSEYLFESPLGVIPEYLVCDYGVLVNKLNTLGVKEKALLEKLKSFLNSRQSIESKKGAVCEQVMSESPKADQSSVDLSPFLPEIQHLLLLIYDSQSRVKLDASLKESHYTQIFSSEYVKSLRLNPSSVMSLLETLDVVSFSYQLILLFVDLSLPSSYFNSLILHLITRKYILSKQESSILLTHLLEYSMVDELEVIDRICPGTRLYDLYRSFVMKGQMVNRSIVEIRRLLQKYCGDISSITTADLLRAVNKTPELIKLSVELTSRNEENDIVQPIQDEDLSDCQDSLVVDEIVDCFHTSGNSAEAKGFSEKVGNCDTSREAKCELLTSYNQKELCNSVIISEPSSGSTVAFDIPPSIEKSLENISISSTPIKKKFYHNSKADDEQQITSAFFNDITHSDRNVSLNAIGKLDSLLEVKGCTALLPFSNTVLGSLTIQLFDKYSDETLKEALLKTLIKVTKSESICQSLRYETLWSLNNDLLKIVQEEIHAVDILINLCTFSSLDILRVYFDLMSNDPNETIMKLIWTHSKRINYESRERVSRILQIVEKFYSEKALILSKASSLILRVATAHLRQCYFAYSDGVKLIGGKYVNKVIDTIIAGNGGSAEAIRGCFV